MSGVNKAIIVGNLGKDPELRYTPANKAVVNFVVATSEEWKDKNTGEKQEKTEWHNIVAFGPRAEVISRYFNKGSSIYVEGKNRTRKWQDKEGNDRYTHEIELIDFQFIGSRNQSDNQGSPQQKPQVEEAPFEDDIPF